MNDQPRPFWFEPSVASHDFFVEPNFDLSQFFFTADSARRLINALDNYSNPCCLCTPRLAHEWQLRGRAVRLLDHDLRFQSIGRFSRFDLLDPQPLEETFDVIVADPVFYTADVILSAVHTLMANSPQAALFIAFPVERQDELLTTFFEFSLRPLSFPLTWCNLKSEYQTTIILYGNQELRDCGAPA